MATITIPSRTAVDLYAAANIPPGTTIRVTHTGGNDVRLAETEAELFTDYIPIGARQSATNQSGDTGAYAWSADTSGVTVRVA